MANILNPLQNSFLDEFFQQTQEFYLTGGTALSAFYLQHRYSEDIDLKF
ncbi:MAG: nucleotidyl transferase AbiEii/AbiGii toxin family protein [bacterium]